MKIVFLFATFFSLSIFASTKTVSISMQIRENHNLMSSPRIQTRFNEKAKISQFTQDAREFVEVTPVETSKGILLKMRVGLFSKEKGRAVVSEPKLLVKEDTPVQVPIGKDDTLTLTVVASRKSL